MNFLSEKMQKDNEHACTDMDIVMYTVHTKLYACVRTCTYIHTHTHTHTHTHLRTHACKFTHKDIFACMYTHIDVVWALNQSLVSSALTLTAANNITSNNVHAVLCIQDFTCQRTHCIKPILFHTLKINIVNSCILQYHSDGLTSTTRQHNNTKKRIKI